MHLYRNETAPMEKSEMACPAPERLWKFGPSALRKLGAARAA